MMFREMHYAEEKFLATGLWKTRLLSGKGERADIIAQARDVYL